MMKSMEPSMTNRMCQKMFKKALANEDDKDLQALQIESVVELMVHYKIGGYGNFIFSKYLEDRRARYKENKKGRKK